MKMVSGTHVENYTNKAIITGNFGGNQNRYEKITFSPGAGSISAGGDNYVEVQTRFNKTDWSLYDQSKDWSYINNSNFANWDKVTVYVDGTLVWGIPPGMSALSSVKKNPTPAVDDDLDENNVYNYPNPFSGKTTIRFSIARQEDVSIRIYDMNMKLVWHKTMDALCLIAGVNRVEWNGINDYGMQVANGVYICEISTSGKTVRKSMALIRNAE